MRYQIPLVTLSLLLFSFVQQEPEKPIYFPTGNEANITGTILLKGTPQSPRLIDMSADPACQKLDRKPQTDFVIVNQGRLKNAFVFVRSEKLNAYRFEVPDSEVILNQRACYFEPHVFGLRAGQPLRIINSDETVHNVHPIPRLSEEWNYSQPPNAPPLVKTFQRAEVFIPIKCNQHPWMRAYAGVMNHPFFAVSDQSGKFEIRGLPAGTYKLIVWHEVYGDQEIEVTLIPGENRNADFTFDAEKIPEVKKFGPEP